MISRLFKTLCYAALLVFLLLVLALAIDGGFDAGSHCAYAGYNPDLPICATAPPPR